MKLKVVVASSNTNSFGLRKMIMVAENGQVYTACANYLNFKDVGSILTVTGDTENKIITGLIRHNFELTQREADASERVMAKVWGVQVAA